jgi:formylglycine-generating enzyme required for sulfatase activity
MAKQWLTTDPCIPDDMVYIPDGEFEMGDHFAPEGWSNERPVHTVLLDAFFMGTCEITNQQYCDYLNSAYPAQLKVAGGVVYASSDDPCDYPYCETSTASSFSQIDYSGGIFSVRNKGGRDMSDDPMVEVSWYGAASYCNWRSSAEQYESCYDISDPCWPCDFSKHGYRLPTEAEWEYAARGGQHNPYYRFPWGDTINHDYANYYANGDAYPYDTSPYITNTFHPDWNDGIYPYTSVVGSFYANGYGLYDMAGNVLEWCNDFYDSNYYSTTPYPHVNPEGPASGSYRVIRGGSWDYFAFVSRVTFRGYPDPGARTPTGGFRIVLDLN